MKIKEGAMTKHVFRHHHYEVFEYHGNTTIERITKSGGKTVSRKWLLFDTVEEAQDFFNSNIDL